MTPQQALTEAGACVACLSPGERQAIQTAAALSIIANDGGGGGGGGANQVFSGHYAGGEPGVTPTTSAAIAYDLDAPGSLWTWDGSSWA